MGKSHLKRSEVAETLGVSQKTAVRLLEKWGVDPCADLGPGRGMGYRWRAADVVAALEKTRPHRTTPAPRPRPRKKKHGLDSDTILADLFGE
jgi:hypothetical protein